MRDIRFLTDVSASRHEYARRGEHINPRGPRYAWTDERVALLRKLWADGLSASQIAVELGGSPSRNAVIGKAHRLGLSRRAQTPSHGRPKTRHSDTIQRIRHKVLRVRKASKSGALRATMVDAPQPIPSPEPDMRDHVVPIGQRRTLLELTDETCRFPLGDPGSADFYFCGGGVSHLSPYCPYHTRIAYLPSNYRAA